MNNANTRIYLSSPHMGGDELYYVHDAFEKNWIAPLGANVDGFETELQDFTGIEHAAVVTSGTAALHLALMLCGVESGDEVICQSMTFTASANPILYQGATPVFVDSEAETWNMDPELLEKAIWDRIQKKGKPKAIIVVDLYGMPAKMEAIIRISEKYDIPVIEDAAEALGSSIDGQQCGTFGLLSVLSFNGNKIITTSGGGALLSDQQELIEKARFLATQARDDAPHYEHSELGYNYRMSNVLAGIGRGQMKVLDDRIAARRKNFNFYFDALQGSWLEHDSLDSEWQVNDTSNSGIYFLPEPEGYFSNRWLTTVLIKPDETGGVKAEEIRVALEKENIECRPLWKPMHQQPLYKEYPHYGAGVSDWLFEYGLCLPSGSNLTDADRSRVVEAISKVLQPKNLHYLKKDRLSGF
ncbi:pyridoxal phosphate-dependent aminotransferase [Aliifodinibius salipaludis]|uniref:GDP-perosamine synthase n=1 Tax=Fodinibius salipaludis TaxID=2032627 RepID=A0A2A2GAZ6_9BACT|nr:aminotransferase class I/II-fold pyridoxal phosphate-dependent enzyme [Aliifodinibius salipaludis]PAU94019.1 pyridoxal phosphate-dependent aminotransferase [Aliifodinibius salipaludis]